MAQSLIQCLLDLGPSLGVRKCSELRAGLKTIGIKDRGRGGMKNMRTLAFVAAIAAVAASNAQNIRFWLAHGDATTATLNGKSVGQELGATTKIGQIGSTFQVRLMATSLATSDVNVTGGGATILYDRVNANAGTTWTTGLDGKLTAGSLGLDATDRNGLLGAANDPGQVRFSPLGANSKRVAGTGFAANPRGAGTYQGISIFDAVNGVGVGNKMIVGAGATIQIGQMTLTNATIAGNEIYGGLGLSAGQSANGGLFLSGFTNGTGVRSSYNVQAVPEPATMLALAAGLSAVAARRRRK